MSCLSTHGMFTGTVKVIQFNLRFYVGSTLGLVSILLFLTSHQVSPSLKAAGHGGALAMLFWTMSSILVSWYVYDWVGVTRWEWMKACLPFVPVRWVNIHAGLDEATGFLKQLFPGTEGIVVDIFDSKKMTEPSIARARRMFPSREPFQIGQAHALPLPNLDTDAVFLLFAAHELRAPDSRTQLLRESGRVLKAGGHVVLVEHLRDFANFIAFGPGFLHFHSANSWLRSLREAGLEVEKQVTITPFVHCFILRKASA
ncbi:MAG TPA: class I SAM-dependent methyltransferase [Terriglobales bacterium]|nr:class I SAM-dependent methyltransferase [Terriglobales bacterium]